MRAVLHVMAVTGVALFVAWTGRAVAAVAPAPQSGGDYARATVFADDGARDRIVSAVQRKYNARVVRVTEIMVDGRRVYELRLQSDQRVWTVRVDADTGQELSGS